MPPLQQILVHGELGLRRDAGRMEEQQDLDFLRDRSSAASIGEVHQLEGLLELLIDHPWLAAAAGRASMAGRP